MNTRGSGFGGRGSDRSPLRVPSPEPRTPNRLPRQVKLFGWVSLLNDFASEMIYPLLPAFVTGVLGGGPQALGALDGAAEFAAAVVKLGAGRLADRTSRRGPLIVLGYLIAVVVRPVIAVTGAAWQVIGLRVVDRLGKGLRTPPRDALIADATPADLVGRAFGLERGMGHAGAVLGPILVWWLLGWGGERPPRAWPDDVAGVARLRDPRGGDGARRHGSRGVGMVPRLGPGGGADREPGAIAGGATRGGSPGERVRGVSRRDGVRGAGGRRGAGCGIPAVRGGAGVSGERGRRAGACAWVARSGAGGCLAVAGS